MALNTPQTHFSRIFYPTAKGFTPFSADASEMGKTKSTFVVEGLCIGDVVLLDPIGEILYLGMNVTKAESDPRNRNIPKDFQHLELDPELDVVHDPAHFPSPTIWAATSDGSSLKETQITQYVKLSVANYS